MKTLLTILMMCISLSLWAQEDELPIEAETHPKITAARAAYITDRLGLTPEEAQKFWPIYNEFASKRQELRKEFINAKKTGKKENELVDLGLNLKQQELDLERDYSKRLIRIITAEKLVQLRTAEKEFRRIIIRQLQQRQLQLDRQNQIKDRQQQRIQQRNN